jgi:hypothetical protein
MNKVAVMLAMVLLFVPGIVLADEGTELVLQIVGFLVSADGFGPAEWLALGTLALHGIAIVIVNVTPTPIDNTIYSRLYRYLLEPAAGLIWKERVKQK